MRAYSVSIGSDREEVIRSSTSVSLFWPHLIVHSTSALWCKRERSLFSVDEKGSRAYLKITLKKVLVDEKRENGSFNLFLWPSLTGLAAGHLLSLTDFYLLLLFNSLSLTCCLSIILSLILFVLSFFSNRYFSLNDCSPIAWLVWWKFRKVQSKIGQRSCRRTYAYVSQLSRALTYVSEIGFPVFFCPRQGKLGHTSFDQQHTLVSVLLFSATLGWVTQMVLLQTQLTTEETARWPALSTG